MRSIEPSRLRLFATLAIGLVMGLGGCSSGQVLTQGEIGRRGARSFAAPPTTVYYACVGALLANGYEIERDDIEQGVIVTRPRAVTDGGPVTARAYRLTVEPDERGGSRVVASPTIYSGGRDVSNRELWNVDGPRGEHQLWTELFGDVDAALAHPAPDPTQREALAKVAVPATDPAAAKMLSPESGLRPATLAPAARPAGASASDSATSGK
jgi:hypothetical protein